jgi:membrane-associated phospholipid phosphatase
MPQTNRTFFFLFIIYVCMGVAVMLQGQHGDEVLTLNRWHSPWRDVFFKYVTHLGDGLLAIGLGLAALLVKFRYAVQILASYGLSSLMAQLLKRVVFADTPRPAAYFPDPASLHWVDGVQILYANSFPSGHSTSAFALFLSLALFWRKPGLDILFFGLAVLAALSRVYLGQHFLVDTLAGAGLGTGTAWLVAAWLARQQSKAWPERRLRFF